MEVGSPTGHGPQQRQTSSSTTPGPRWQAYSINGSAACIKNGTCISKRYEWEMKWEGRVVSMHTTTLRKTAFAYSLYQFWKIVSHHCSSAAFRKNASMEKVIKVRVCQIFQRTTPLPICF